LLVQRKPSHLKITQPQPQKIKKYGNPQKPKERPKQLNQTAPAGCIFTTILQEISSIANTKEIETNGKRQYKTT
jgi:hypothetical protein